MMRRPFFSMICASVLLGAGLLTSLPAAHAASATAQSGRDARLASGNRFERNGWTYVHLQGSPEQIGYQHGYLLAHEIVDTKNAIQLLYTHNTKRDWGFFREASRTMLWPHIDAEYQQELSGIVEGLKARGVKDIDVYDMVAMNADMELADYYVPWLNKTQKAENVSGLGAPDNCSAFIATGSYTKDGKIVMAHNNWSTYIEGSRWTVVFDIQPASGHRLLMDGMPGVITSQDDFGVNDAGIMITETTIGSFVGWNTAGKPEFVRSRKAMQYASSIDDYARIMRDGDNGGYANDWLIGDRKTGEIGYLELGLKHTPLWRTKDGYFVSSNFARDPGLIKDETAGYNPNDRSQSNNARHVRWEQIIRQNKGTLDAAEAERFMADHQDSYVSREQPDGRTLCGHVDLSQAGIGGGWGPYYPAGAVQGKVMDANMAANMSFVAHAGHPCGDDFLAQPFLAAHPEYAWQAPALRDMKSGPWTVFKAGEKPAGASSQGAE